MNYENNYSGVINVYKERGYTSFDVVSLVRKFTRCRTGHAGTLDPEAEGVLPVCVGSATKLCAHLTDKPKEYVAHIRLGVETDTYDATGNILDTRKVSVSRKELLIALSSFIPGYYQIPPMYSAIKINGKKLYELARKGAEVEREPRPVVIAEIELCEFTPPDLIEIRVACSKGTYIRSLAHDIGEKLSCGAHMESLLRTKCGNFRLKDSLKLERIKIAAETGRITDLLMPIENVLSEYLRATAREDAEKYLLNGNALSENNLANPEAIYYDGARLLVFSHSGRLAGIYEKRDGLIRPMTIFPAGEDAE